MAYTFDNNFDFESLREYIEQADIVGSNIFLLEKPKQVKAKTYIVYNFRELNGGTAVRQYQVNFRVVSDNVLTCNTTKNALIQLLDLYDRPCNIYGIRSIKMLNGGGLTYSDETKEFNCFLYFAVRV